MPGDRNISHRQSAASRQPDPAPADGTEPWRSKTST